MALLMLPHYAVLRVVYITYTSSPVGAGSSSHEYVVHISPFSYSTTAVFIVLGLLLLLYSYSLSGAMNHNVSMCGTSPSMTLGNPTRTSKLQNTRGVNRSSLSVPSYDRSTGRSDCAVWKEGACSNHGTTLHLTCSSISPYIQTVLRSKG